MRISILLKIIGLLLMLFSTTMLVPAALSFWFEENVHTAFLHSFSIIAITGGLLWLMNFRANRELGIRDGFLVVSAFWLVLGLAGSIPLVLAEQPNMSWPDAIFESISGLTTTGATVLTGLDDLPKAVLYYRQQLQWIGGIGIIVIAVAILPLLGIGGMQLYRAETPGPMKDSKLSPRIGNTAKLLFIMYVNLTLACAFAFWLAGMSVFDAICHSFSTVAIGGFSTHDASMGYFESPLILLICSGFMLFAGINFTVHYLAFRSKNWWHYLIDSETRFYIFTVLTACTIAFVFLYQQNIFSLNDAAIHGLFSTISYATTTGFTTSDVSLWPSFLPVLLILMSCMGGCGGSTAGGIKVVRVMLMAKQGIREMAQLVHPNAVVPLKVGNRRVEAKVVSAVWSFFAVYIFSFMLIFLLVLATGVEYVTAFSATAASINNLGPGLGDVSAHYGNIPDITKGILCFAMLLGRLEIFTLLVIFPPAFWRY